MRDMTKAEAFDAVCKMAVLEDTDPAMLKGMLGAVCAGWAVFRTEDGFTPAFAVTIEGRQQNEEFMKTSLGKQIYAKLKWDDARGRVKMPGVKPSNGPSST
jgi:hypothetical protein